jgi:AcrR family transcriptional regulator
VARIGRRPGNPDTRQAILAAARAAFADRGFDGASIRAIATAAGVDPALVHHYFGSKDQLFLEVMSLPLDPGPVVAEVMRGGRDRAGERLIAAMLSVWDSPAGAAAAALVRSAVANDVFARMLREFVTRNILRRIAKELGLDPAEAGLRTNLVATQIMGVIVARYIIRLEPIASTPPEVLAPLMGSTVQRYLTMPLDGPASEPTPPAPTARVRKNQRS